MHSFSCAWNRRQIAHELLVTNLLSSPQFLDETFILQAVSLPLLCNDLTLRPLLSLSLPYFVRAAVLIRNSSDTPELGEDPRLAVFLLHRVGRGGLTDLVLVRPGDRPDGVVNVDV